jgi:predicted dehydrogenase
MIRLAVLGLGAVTRNIHLPAYRQLADKVSLVGGCDVQTDACDAFRGSHPSVPVFTDPEKMLASVQADIVAICTPPFLHREQTLLALRHRCHVFCEKPLVENLADADELIASADAAGRQLVVNSQFPYMAIHRAAKARLGQPDFGKLLFLHASQTFRPTAQTEGTWRKEMARRLGFEFGVHVFELIRYFFDEEPVRLCAHMPNPVGSKADVINTVNIEFSSGRAASILLDRLSRGPERYLDLRLDGEHAAISTSIGGELAVEAGLFTRERKPYVSLRFAKGGKALWQDGNRSRVIATDGINPFASSTAYHLGAFIDALAAKREPAGHARDHRNTLALIFAAYDSAAEKRWVDLESYRAPARVSSATA